MIGKRLAVRGLEALCRAMWGFPPTIIGLVVDHMGPLRAIGWFGAHMPRFLASRVVLGSVRVHLACIVVSLRNGCVYCAYGHVYALELLYLRQHGRLFPIDATALEGWYDLDPRTLRPGSHRSGDHVWTGRDIGGCGGRGFDVGDGGRGGIGGGLADAHSQDEG